MKKRFEIENCYEKLERGIELWEDSWGFVQI